MKVRHLLEMLATADPEREVVLHLDTGAAGRVMASKFDLDDRRLCPGEMIYYDDDGGEVTETCEHSYQECGERIVTDQMYELEMVEMERMDSAQPNVAVGRGSRGPIIALRITGDVSPDAVVGRDTERRDRWYDEQEALTAERSARLALQCEVNMRNRAAAAMRNRMAV